ncbi:MAG: hypothetical protein ACLVKA_05675 [Collinsella aerofaciens]
MSDRIGCNPHGSRPGAFSVGLYLTGTLDDGNAAADPVLSGFGLFGTSIFQSPNNSLIMAPSPPRCSDLRAV